MSSSSRPRVNIHPYEQLTAPTGEIVEIDLEMVRLVKAIWSLGMATVACCQHVGDGLGGPLTGKPLYTAESFVSYSRGYAWLKMPVQDAERLANMLLKTEFRDMVSHRWHSHGWRIYVPMMHHHHTGIHLADDAQIYFPRLHTFILANTLTDIRQKSRSEADS